SVGHPVFDVVGQGPVGQAPPAAQPVAPAVEEQQQVVTGLPHQAVEAVAAYRVVEFIAVEGEQSLSGGGFVHRLPVDLDIEQCLATQLAEVIVVVAGNIDHAVAGGGQIEQLLHY